MHINSSQCVFYDGNVRSEKDAKCFNIISNLLVPPPLTLFNICLGLHRQQRAYLPHGVVRCFVVFVREYLEISFDRCCSSVFFR